VSSTAL